MFIRVNPTTKDIEVVFNAQVAAQLRLESAEILFSELGAAIEEVTEGLDLTGPEPVVEPEPAVEPEPEPAVAPEPAVEPEPVVEPEPED
ncbi:hypothetical protein ES703_28683 [subsurface metagenome]